MATAGVVGLISALAVNGTFGNTPATAAPITARLTQHATITRALQAIAKTASSSASYYAYIAAETGSEVVEVNVSAGSIVGTISAGGVEGVAVTPDGSTAYLAETGQYYVIADDLATKAQTKIEVGAYPQDVAASPTSRQARQFAYLLRLGTINGVKSVY